MLASLKLARRTVTSCFLFCLLVVAFKGGCQQRLPHFVKDGKRFKSPDVILGTAEAAPAKDG